MADRGHVLFSFSRYGMQLHMQLIRGHCVAPHSAVYLKTANDIFVKQKCT